MAKTTVIYERTTYRDNEFGPVGNYLYRSARWAVSVKRGMEESDSTSFTESYNKLKGSHPHYFLVFHLGRCGCLFRKHYGVDLLEVIQGCDPKVPDFGNVAHMSSDDFDFITDYAELCDVYMAETPFTRQLLDRYEDFQHRVYSMFKFLRAMRTDLEIRTQEDLDKFMKPDKVVV